MMHFKIFELVVTSVVYIRNIHFLLFVALAITCLVKLNGMSGNVAKVRVVLYQSRIFLFTTRILPMRTFMSIYQF